MTTTRLPSIASLTEVFGPRAQEARELLEKKRQTTDYKSVTDWERDCYYRPKYRERLLCALDEIAGTHGIGVIYADDEITPLYEYLETGDAYAPTLVLSHKTGTFRVRCWADYVGE